MVHKKLIKVAILNASGALFSILGGVILARFLGPQGFGIYAYSMALLTLLVIVVEFGFPTVALRSAATMQTNPSACATSMSSAHGRISSSFLYSFVVFEYTLTDCPIMQDHFNDQI